MAIELEKVSPPKTYGELFNSIGNVDDLFGEDIYAQTELRGGIGNKVLLMWNNRSVEVEDSTLANIQDSFEERFVNKRPPINIERGDLLYNSYIESHLEDLKEDVECHEICMWTSFKTFIRNNIILLIMNHINNETLYEKLVNSIFDSLILENGNLD